MVSTFAQITAQSVTAVVRALHLPRWRDALRRRLLGLLLAMVAICGAPFASALGLGELEVDSALNEKFSGRIELLDAQGLQDSEIIISLASREDFERVGVERFFYLTNLEFSIDMGGSSGPVVVVSSKAPISEPYLNFIVEILRFVR